MGQYVSNNLIPRFPVAREGRDIKVIVLFVSGLTTTDGCMMA